MYKFVAVIVFRFPPTIVFVAANVFRFGPPSRSCAEQIKSWGCCSLSTQRKSQGAWPAAGPGAGLPLRRRRFTRAPVPAALVPGGTAFWALAPFGAGSAFPLDAPANVSSTISSSAPSTGPDTNSCSADPPPSALYHPDRQSRSA